MRHTLNLISPWAMFIGRCSLMFIDVRLKVSIWKFQFETHSTSVNFSRFSRFRKFPWNDFSEISLDFALCLFLNPSIPSILFLSRLFRVTHCVPAKCIAPVDLSSASLTRAVRSFSYSCTRQSIKLIAPYLPVDKPSRRTIWSCTLTYWLAY